MGVLGCGPEGSDEVLKVRLVVPHWFKLEGLRGRGGEIAEKETEVKQEFGLDWIKKRLGDKVASACALASGFSATLDRLMNTQNSSSRRVLEINPDHLIIKTLLVAYKSDSEDGVEEQTEVALQNLSSYKENCVDISKEGFGGEIAEKETEVKQEFGLDWIKKRLGDKVASACALASGFSATLDRLMNTQNSSSRRVLEINPDHLIIKTLLVEYKSDSEDEFLRVVDLSPVDSAPIYLYLVPADLTVEQFAYVIRKRIKLSADKPIFIFVDNVLPPTGAIMSAIHEEKKDDDGFCNI